MEESQEKDDKIKEMLAYGGKLTPGEFKKTRIIYVGCANHLR